MYCRKCGAEIKETSKFCDNCGCEVVKVKQVSYAEKYNENKKKSKNQAQSNKEQERMMKHKESLYCSFVICNCCSNCSSNVSMECCGKWYWNKLTYENSYCCICFISGLSCDKSETSE